MHCIRGRSSRLRPAIEVWTSAWVGLALALIALPAAAQVQRGFAAAYPGDHDIAADPRVVFFEDFETGTVGDLGRSWDQVVTGGGMTLPDDSPAESRGSRSVQITATGGGSAGGHLYTRLPIGLDTVFVRYYVKYGAGPAFDGHTGLWMGGYNPPTPYPQGNAGIRPAGDDRFFLTFQPFGTSRMDFYAYWMGMSGLPNGWFWGNSFLQDPGLQPAYDEWMCIEVMVKGNAPTNSTNGELALWIDGVPVTHMGPGFPNGDDTYGVFTPDQNGAPWPGFQWRSTPALKANFVWLSMYEPYLTRGTQSRVLYDQVVVATEYIGPIGVETVPEPGFTMSLLMGFLLLSCLSRSSLLPGLSPLSSGRGSRTGLPV